MSDQEKLAAFLNTCDKCDEASTHNFCDKHFAESEEPTIENRGLGSGVVETCTRPLPHICAVNGPCNGWPQSSSACSGCGAIPGNNHSFDCPEAQD